MRTHVAASAATILLLAAGCTESVNVEQERTALSNTDRDWSQSTNDADKFASFYAQDASFYAAGIPIVKGQAAIHDVLKQLASAPGFALQVSTTNTQVGAAGDIGYTTGTYQLSQAGGSEKGKFVTVWKKQADGAWRVTEDIFNADEVPAPAPGQHTLVAPASVVWGPAPPSLPPGAKFAVLSGDPSKSEPFVARAELPAGYTIAPHWHPTDEHVTVLAGTFAVGMGDALDKTAMQDLPSGGYVLLPAQMHHYAMAKTAVTIQVHGMGPFVVNYVNPDDDPSRARN